MEKMKTSKNKVVLCVRLHMFNFGLFIFAVCLLISIASDMYVMCTSN